MNLKRTMFRGFGWD